MTLTYGTLFGGGDALYGDFDGPLYGTGTTVHDLVFTLGRPQARWDTETPVGRWAAKNAAGRWSAKSADGRWKNGEVE